MDVPGPSNMSTYAQWAHMVECPICYSLYDKPMQMSCGHTLCSSCIGQLVDQVKRNPEENQGPRMNLAILEGGAIVGAGIGNFIDQFDDVDQQFLEVPRMDQREFQNMRGMIAIPPRRSVGTTIKCPECRTPTFVPNDGLPVNYRVQELVAKVAPMFKDRHLVKHCNQCEEILSQGVYFNCTQCTENCTKICSTCIVRSHNGHTIDEVRVLTSKDVREMKSKIEKYQQEALQALEEVKPRLADIGGSIETETMQKLNDFTKVFENMIEAFDNKIEEHTTSADLEVEVKKAAEVADLFKGSLKRLNEGLFAAIKDAVTKFWDPFEKMRVHVGFAPAAEPPAVGPAAGAPNAQAQEEIAAGEAVAVAAAQAVIQPINRRPIEGGMRNRNAQQAVVHFGNVQRQRQRQRQQFGGQPMQIFQHMMMNMPQPPQNQMQVMRGPPPPPQARPMQQVMHHPHHVIPPQMPHQQMQPMNMFPVMPNQPQQQQPQMHPRAQQQMMGQVINHHPQQQFQNMHMAPQRQMHPHPQMMQQGHPQQPMHMHMGAPQNQQMQMQRHPNDPRDFPQQQPPPAPRMNVVQRMHPQFVQQQHEQQAQMQQHQMQQVPMQQGHVQQGHVQQGQMQQGQPPIQQQAALRAQQPPVDIPQGPWVQQMPAVNQEQPPQFPFNDGEIPEVHEAPEAEPEEPDEPVQRLNPDIEAFRVANANMQEYHDMRDRLQADAIVLDDVDVNLGDELQPLDPENAAIQMPPDMIGRQEGFAHFQEMREEVDAIVVDGFNNGEAGEVEHIQDQQQGFIELYDNPQVDDQVAVEEVENAAQEPEIIEAHPVIVIDDREEEQEVVAQHVDRNLPRRSARRDNSIEVSPELRRSTRSSARNATHHEEPSTSSGTSEQPARSPSPSNVPKRRRVDRKPIPEEPEEMDESNEAPAETSRPSKRRATTSSSQGAPSTSSSGAPATRRQARS